MIDIISKAIDQYYRKKDYDTFRALCNKPLQLFKELKNYIKLQKFTLVEETDDDSPSRTWYIKFNDYKKGNLEISYHTIIKISKVVPAFYIQHEFSVEHKNENAIDPDLSGFGCSPYTKEQFALDDKIRTVLVKKGYYELNLLDMDECVHGFKMPEGVTIFGQNVTVELLLFIDIYNICPNESARLFQEMISKNH